ncbi:hypothetical protein IC582_002411 [Cucumis melo]
MHKGKAFPSWVVKVSHFTKTSKSLGNLHLFYTISLLLYTSALFLLNQPVLSFTPSYLKFPKT